MRLRITIAAALVLLATQVPAASAAPPGEAPPAAAPPPAQAPTTAVNPPTQPVVTATRQNAFTIPFRIAPAQTPAEQPVEVQLHVSTNQGAAWELSARVKPEKASFAFRAPHDGEYWYAIRTVDKQGVTRPDAPLEPQLKVIVDTVAPRLDMTAFRGDNGEIVARWQAVDPHLKPGSFKLEYQPKPDGPWERVAVEAPPAAMRHTLAGEGTWWPRVGSENVRVRAEITDQAGNPAVSQTVVNLGPVSPPPTGPITPPAGAPVATAPMGDVPGRFNPPSAPSSAPSSADATRWPADRATTDPLDRRGPPGTGATEPTPSAPRATFQPVSQTRGRPGSPLDFSLLPNDARPRMVNSRAFELEYDVESVGPSGIAKVELWGTRDGGRTWTIFGSDADRRTPVPVNVDGEGIYGFRVVVQSGSGLGGTAPGTGDMPDIWLGVDLTKPTAKITSANVDTASGELTIRWESADDVPDPRGVSLFYATTAGGPWTAIVTGVENTDSYVWRLDNRVPDRVFIRLEVRDEAGNVGSFDTLDPVSLDRHRPEGRIRGVRAVGK